MPENDSRPQNGTTAGPQQQYPGQLSPFTDKLLFANASVASLAGINGWDLRIAAGVPGGNAVVPPISADCARLLMELRMSADNSIPPRRPSLELVDMCILKDDFAASGEVTVQITLRSDTQVGIQSKTYRGKDIVYVNNFPYLNLWPCVYLAPDEWKDYYVAMVPAENPVPKPAGSECEEIDAARGYLFTDFMFDAPEKDVRKVKLHDEMGKPFDVLHTEQFPWFIPLQYTDSQERRPHEGGCLVARPAGSMVIPNAAGVAMAAIDFGASNSFCAVRCGSTTISKVLDGKLVEPLVRFLPGSMGAAAAENFHRFYGPSAIGRDGKFPSVAQMYDLNSNKPLEDGHILLAENDVIRYFAAQNSNLKASGVYNEMRTSSLRFADNNWAARMFVTQLVMLCALAAKRSGYRSIEYGFSYPDELRRNDLREIWMAAISYIRSRNIFASVEARCITEGDAAAQYVLHDGTLLTRSVPEAGFAVVDIGGGTTTMTIWRAPADRPSSPPQKLGDLSFRYAGNQIFSNSFFSWFKHNPQDLETSLPRLFGYRDLTLADMWVFSKAADRAAQAVKENKAKKAIRSYIDLIGGVDRISDLAYPTLTALLNGLLEEPGIDPAFWNAPMCEDLRTMVNFKLKGILFMLANLIWECDGIRPEFGPYNIFLVGGGTQAFCLLRDAPGLIFRENAKEMLAALTDIDLAAGTETFRFVQPGAIDPKAAVANGALICMERPIDTFLVEPAPDKDKDDRIGSKLEVIYRAFVEFAVKGDSSLQSLLPKLELPPSNGQPEPDQLFVKNNFTAGARNVWYHVDRDLDKNISERLRLSFFAVRMAEELLNIQ